MSIKEKSTTISKSYEYKSPDDEIYDVQYLESPDRKYVKIKLSQSTDEDSSIVLDWDLLSGIVDAIRGSLAVTSNVNLPKPDISDLRDNSNTIQTQVNNSMERYDGSVSPFENISDSPDTPNEWKIDSGDEEWKQDVEERKKIPKPIVSNRGHEGSSFRREDTGNLI